MLLVLLLLLRI